MIRGIWAGEMVIALAKVSLAQAPSAAVVLLTLAVVTAAPPASVCAHPCMTTTETCHMLDEVKKVTTEGLLTSRNLQIHVLDIELALMSKGQEVAAQAAGCDGTVLELWKSMW